MTAPAQPPDPLDFPPPGRAPAGNPVVAVREALKLPARLLRKAQELKDGRDQLQAAWDESNRIRDRLDGFVVRNLIQMADNCKPALAPPAAGGEGEAAPAPSPEAACLASVYRTVLYLLEELGVAPVDLLGRTYRDVTVDGQAIDDPFDVHESDQKGRTDEVRVREVIHDLWVVRRGGHVEVLRRGLVNC